MEVVTLEDAARFFGLLRLRRQAWPHRDYAAELLPKAAQPHRHSMSDPCQVEYVDRRAGLWPPAGAPGAAQHKWSNRRTPVHDRHDQRDPSS